MGNPGPTPVEQLRDRLQHAEAAIHRLQGQIDMLEQLLRAAMLIHRDEPQRPTRTRS